MRAAALLVAVIAFAAPQDVEYERALERAQKAKPARLGPSARIAPAGEPGSPLVINGRVFQADGRTPAAGVTVFAYHTDAHGVYDVPANGPHSWRLRGWAVTGGDGRFTFQTIRPASYPNATVPQHVHLSFEGPGVPRRFSGEIEFDDDPKVTAQQRAASRAAGMFGTVRPVATRNGVDYVDSNFRIVDRRVP
jgi:protocatechuate 3,4-dioxygenase beta subunit